MALSIKHKLISMVLLVLLCALALGSVSFWGLNKQGKLFQNVAVDVQGVLEKTGELNRNLRETAKNSSEMGNMAVQLGNEFKGVQHLINDSDIFFRKQRRENILAVSAMALQLLERRIESAKFLADAAVKSTDVRKSVAGFYIASAEEAGLDVLEKIGSISPYEDQGIFNDFVGSLVSSANANFYVVLGLSGDYRAKGIYSNEEILFDADFSNSHLFKSAMLENRLTKGLDHIGDMLFIGSAGFLKTVYARDIGMLVCGYWIDQSMLRFLSEDLKASLVLFMANGQGAAKYSTLVDMDNDVVSDITLPVGLLNEFNEKLSLLHSKAESAGTIVDGRHAQKDLIVVKEIEVGRLNYVMAYQGLLSDDGILLGVLGIARDITGVIARQGEIIQKAELAVSKVNEIESSRLIIAGENIKSLEKAMQLIDSTDRAEAQLKRSLKSAGSVASNTRFVTMIALMIALAVGISIAYMVDQTIIEPLKQVVYHLKKVSDGDLTGEPDIKEGTLKRKDEVGILANVLITLISNLSETVKVAERVAGGELDVKVKILSKKDSLGKALTVMIRNLVKMTRESTKEDWLKTGQNQLNEVMRGEQDIIALSQNILNYLAGYLTLQIGAFYLADSKQTFKLTSSFAYTKRGNIQTEFQLGEGLIGQAALERKSILYTRIPADYHQMMINYGMGEFIPSSVFVLPLVHENQVMGILSFGTTGNFSDMETELLDKVAENIAVNLNSAVARVNMKKLLEKTQAQSRELKARQNELKAANSELEKQTEVLKKSESRLLEQQEELQLQQEELQTSNEEMEEKTEMLENQKAEIEKKNLILVEKQREVKEKASQLELATKYKSEFLSNMSHELRTPLNSMLLLAKMLSENEEENMTDDQVDSAQSIHRSGQTLLRLINDILDLSKIEARKVELSISKVKIDSLVSGLKNEFGYVARDKGLEFHAVIEEGLPDLIVTDEQRLEQIIRNLLGNALKFTANGSVSLRVGRPAPGTRLYRKDLDCNHLIAFSVEDTGYGIAEDKLNLIFEAFKQVDGSISRRHGGTGLGLSISKELALYIGGELGVKSTLGKGSVFTLYIPDNFQSASLMDAGKIKSKPSGKGVIPDAAVENGKAVSLGKPEIIRHPDTRKMLIIEDDNEFAAILAGFFRKNGYESVIASDGESGIKYVIEEKPTAVILDIGLPGIDGWTVLNELKNNPDTRHIPVHIMSAYDNIREGLQKGAVGYLTKPISTKEIGAALDKIEAVLESEVKELLVVEDDSELRETILKLMGTNDINTTAIGTGKEALELLALRKFDCMILDLGLPDISGFDLLEKITETFSAEKTPIIIYTGRDLTKEEAEKLERYSSSIVLKSAVSLDRLLDETALFMHRIESDMPETQQKMIQKLRDKESVLTGKKVLIVDDDMRNAFALKKFLKTKGMSVMIADNGQKALELMNEGLKPDIILMDIMMPVMDGYETMKKIRKERKLRDIPILALTAKAMESDREACIKSGANDYLSKPVDVAKLLSMLRVWLY